MLNKALAASFIGPRNGHLIHILFICQNILNMKMESSLKVEGLACLAMMPGALEYLLMFTGSTSFTFVLKLRLNLA